MKACTRVGPEAAFEKHKGGDVSREGETATDHATWVALALEGAQIV